MGSLLYGQTAQHETILFVFAFEDLTRAQASFQGRGEWGTGNRCQPLVPNFV